MARIIKSFDKILDILDNIKGGQFVSIGYISAVKNWNNPPKKINPKTGKGNRNDYSRLSDMVGAERPNGEEISGIIKITRYSGLNYVNNDTFAKQYDAYNTKRKEIYDKYRISDIADKPVGSDDTARKYQTRVDFGKHGKKIYDTNDIGNEKFGRTYTNQNVAKAKKDSVYYTVDTDGNIVDVINPSSLKGYLKKQGIPYEKTLREAGMGDKFVNDYVKQMEEINRDFVERTFITDNVLYISATVGKQPIIYINDRSKMGVTSKINVDPAQLEDMTREQYAQVLPEGRLRTRSAARNTVSENRLRRIIRKIIFQTLNN